MSDEFVTHVFHTLAKIVRFAFALASSCAVVWLGHSVAEAVSIDEHLAEIEAATRNAEASGAKGMEFIRSLIYLPTGGLAAGGFAAVWNPAKTLRIVGSLVKSRG